MFDPPSKPQFSSFRVSTSPPEMRGWPGCLASLALQVCFTAKTS